ncbi:Halorhodopsin [Frankliniella fusca]|uniref:Halorhodopsin n=1 Tax=Frankliniella fusca TaxID=407009 RepID=A0AAE1H2S2_9NEOP|nr:Halorhodopsin [Frankliniella fusca]
MCFTPFRRDVLLFKTRRDNDGGDDSDAGVGGRTVQCVLSVCGADVPVRDGAVHCEEYDGVPCSWGRHDVWELSSPSPTKNTTSEDDEGAHPIHIQAGGVFKVIVFW